MDRLAVLRQQRERRLRRDLWERRPFDEALPGLEDIEWVKHWMEAGYRAVSEPETAVYHIHTETWRQVQRRYFREALAAKRLRIKSASDIVGDLATIGPRTVVDLGRAWQTGQLRARADEIIRFRAHQAAGVVQGLTASLAMFEDPVRRQDVLFDRTYRRVVVRGPGDAVLEEAPMSPPKPGEVLIEVAYVGVCATDLEIVDGVLAYYRSGLASYPIVPGHEFAGRVVATGSKAVHLAPGQAVVAECIQTCGQCGRCRSGNEAGCASRRELGVWGKDGACVQYACVPAEFVHSLPPDVDLARAALCEPLAVVLKGLRRVDRAPALRGGGGGALSHLCALVLADQGHAVAAFDRSARRRALLDGTGVEAAEDLGLLAGFDLVVEATGNADALNDVLERSRPGALLLLLGLPYAERACNFERIVCTDKSVVGSVGSAKQDFTAAIELVPRLKIDRFLETQFGLDEYEKAWRAVRSGEHLKVLLTVSRRLDG